jgi:sulfur-carrier protein
MIRVILPYHLRTLAGVDGEVTFEVYPSATLAILLDAVENRYPVLRGTIRDSRTGERRPLIRYFACGEDLSLDSPATVLPADVLSGRQPFRIVGAMSGG